MSDNDLKERIESLPALKRAADQLAAEVSFRAHNSVQFDPFLIVAVISIIVQVIIHCREKKTDDELRADIRDIRTLPPRKLMRLKRRMNALYKKQNGVEATTLKNPVLDAVYDMAEKLDDAAIDELLALATAAA